MHGILSTEEELLRDKDMIANTLGLANGGIALAVVEPEKVGCTTSDTLQVCSRIIEAAGKELAFESSLMPCPRTKEDVICLSRDVGVSPLPEWYMRGEGPQSMTS